MNTDHIDFYSEEQLLEWLADFESPLEEDETAWIPLWKDGIPFSYPEIQRELVRRDNCRAALEK